MNRAWIFVALTLLGTVAGQLVLKYAVGRHGEIALSSGRLQQAWRRGGREAAGVQNDRVHRPHHLDVDLDDAGEPGRCGVERELEPIVRRTDVLGQPTPGGIEIESRCVGSRQQRCQR